jgi:hypothetical protein
MASSSSAESSGSSCGAACAAFFWDRIGERSMDLGEGAPLGLLVIDVEDHGTALELVLSDLLAVGELPAKDAPGPPAGLANS